MLRRLFFILPLLLGTLLLLILVDWNPASQTVTVEAEPREVDFFVINARRVQFNADGSLHSQLVSPKVEHLLKTEVSLLKKPDLLLYQDNPQPWRVQSEQAQVSPDGKQVELIDKVRISRHDDRNRDILVTSAQMTLFLEDDYATTDAPVRIETIQGVTTGTGMQAWLKERQLNLLSTTRGQYEAP